MKRKRKNIRFFYSPILGETPRSLDSRGALRFDFERKEPYLQVSITQTVGAEKPDLTLRLDRREVEHLLAHLCAFLLDKEIGEIQDMAEEIAEAADTLEGQ